MVRWDPRVYGSKKFRANPRNIHNMVEPKPTSSPPRDGEGMQLYRSIHDVE